MERKIVGEALERFEARFFTMRQEKWECLWYVQASGAAANAESVALLLHLVRAY
jgi:hypothetical protein